MTDEQIINLILSDLKTKSPRHLIADILKPNGLWNPSEEQRFKNIFNLLKTDNLITTSSDKYFGAADIELTITGGLKYNSYSDFLEMEKNANTPTQVTNIDKRHIGDKTTNVFNDSTIGQVIQDSSFSNSPNKIKTAAAPNSSPDKKSLLKKIYSSPWTIGIALLAIEEVTFKSLYKIIISWFNTYLNN